MFGLFIWHNDRPIAGNVFNLSTIQRPRKSYEDYMEGDIVDVRYPKFGIVPGIIARISGKK